MKKLALVAVAMFALSASAVYYGRIATDYGSKTVINHSEGVAVFPYGKFKLASNAVKAYYTTTAIYPTTFGFDAGEYVADGGSHAYTLIEDADIVAPDAGTKYCMITPPSDAQDGNTVIYDYGNGDGLGTYGAIMSDTLSDSVSPWPAICFVQSGPKP